MENNNNFFNKEIPLKFPAKKPKFFMKRKSAISLAVFLILFLWLWSQIYLPRDFKQGQEIVFSIKSGQGLKDISLNLKNQGIIRSKFLFKVYVLLADSAKELKAGKYKLSASLNIPQIINKFVKGETIKEKIVILEGWNLQDIADYFEKRGISPKDDFFKEAGYPAAYYFEKKGAVASRDFSENFSFLEEKPKNIGLEGYLFPDTYEIKEGEGIDEILTRLLDNFGKKITPDLKEEAGRQKKTFFEVLTMASLLEKEVRTIEDKKVVAGILWKRLKNGWPLQVDSTLTYITGKESKDLTKKDMEIDSPYNTYRYKNLPLGPIANPGIESIKAALYYEESPYWFYLTTPEGKTVLSRTLEEHVAAKNKYLK